MFNHAHHLIENMANEIVLQIQLHPIHLSKVYVAVEKCSGQ